MAKSAARSISSTRIDLTNDVRSQVCEILNQALADASDLSMQAKSAHWNVKGPHFIALHKLFDKLYEEVSEHVDTIAERVGALGGLVKGRLQDAHDNTRLKPYPADITDGMAHVRALADSFAKFANEIRGDIDKCEDLEDKVTGDILNAITADIDKNLWFLEAHLR